MARDCRLAVFSWQFWSDEGGLWESPRVESGGFLLFEAAKLRSILPSMSIADSSMMPGWDDVGDSGCSLW